MKLIIASVIFCIFVIFLRKSDCGRILVIQPVPTNSYNNIMRAIVETLSTEHQITFISRYDMKLIHPNITEIIINESKSNLFGRYRNLFKQVMAGRDVDYVVGDMGRFIDSEYIRELMKTDAIQYLFNTKMKFDVLITVTFAAEPIFKFSHYFNIPLIQIATSYALPWQNKAIGNPNYLSTDPSLIFSFDTKSIFNQFQKYIKNLFVFLWYEFITLSQMENILSEYFPAHTPTVYEISANTSLLLINTNVALVQSKPMVLNSIQIGGIHCKPPQSLSDRVKDFVDASDGIIYVSFGSTIPNFPNVLIEKFINVFRKLPQRIIWKVKQTDSFDFPENVMTMEWCPQQDILGHNKTKLFITHGGMLSLLESVYHAVPILVMPVALDQPTNARLAQELNIGRYLLFKDLTEDNLLKQIQAVFSNPMYNTNIKRLSVLMRDTQFTAADKLRWWINYIIRHKGFPLEKSHQNQWINTLYTDLITVILLIYCSVSFVIKCVCKLFVKTSHVTKQKIL